MELKEVIKQQRLTEKANLLVADLNQYVFDVHLCANKHHIAQAVESLYGVHVKAGKVLNYPKKRKSFRGKTLVRGFTSQYKKAIVSVSAGEKIDLMQ
mgnify:CR=1 FL=1